MDIVVKSNLRLTNVLNDFVQKQQRATVVPGLLASWRPPAWPPVSPSEPLVVGWTLRTVTNQWQTPHVTDAHRSAVLPWVCLWYQVKNEDCSPVYKRLIGSGFSGLRLYRVQTIEHTRGTQPEQRNQYGKVTTGSDSSGNATHHLLRLIAN